MTTNQTPADPSAYRTVCSRNVSGIVDHIAIHGPDGAALVVVEDDDAERLISLAMDEERGEPGMLPSQRAFAAAALRDLGIPILGEEDDDEDDEDDEGDEGDEGEDWRDVPLLVIVADAEPSIAMAGEFCDANAEETALQATVRSLVEGRADWVRFGGGAAPEVLVTRMDEPGRRGEAAGALRALLAKAEAADALLEAAKALLGLWDACFNPAAPGPEPLGGHMTRLRAAIAAAEGSAATPAPAWTTIGITLEGGLVQGVWSEAHDALRNVRVVVVDYDTQGADDDEVTREEPGADGAILGEWHVARADATDHGPVLIRAFDKRGA